MTLQIDSVRLFDTNLHAARQFYAGLLALPLVADGSSQGFCVFQCGAVQLVLETVPPDAPADDRALVGRFTGLRLVEGGRPQPQAGATCARLGCSRSGDR